MTRAFITVLLLIGSNCFMTMAWYGHLKKAAWGVPLAVLVGWLLAFPEYLMQVPANRLGHHAFGGPFTAAQLKILQEAITLVIFLGFAILVLKERPRVNELVAMGLIFLAVVVAMQGRAPLAQSGGEPEPTPAQAG